MSRALYASLTGSTLNCNSVSDDERVMGGTTDMLDSNQVSPNERYVVNLSEHANDTSMIDSGNEDSKEISQQGGVLLQIECQSFVVATTLSV